MKWRPLVVAKPSVSLKDACLSAVILGLANMGDAFLYVYLPANFQQIGVSTLEVGVILSINRFTRLFLNGSIAWLVCNKGIKTAVLVATLIASITTISYGLIAYLFLWIMARVFWGISFSTLRLGNTLYAMAIERKGFALGISRALIELGPVAALVGGPFLVVNTGQSFTFLKLGLISAAGILLVLPLSDLKIDIVSKKDLVLSYPSSFNVLVLINAFITEGLLVVLLGRLIQDQHTLNLMNLLALTGILLGYRRLALVLFSPLSGWLADKWGFQSVFIYTLLLSSIGLLCLLLGGTIIGIITTFTFSAMNSSIATGGAINSKFSIIKNVSDNVTWRDIGTATGTMTGALLLSFSDLRLILGLLIIAYCSGLLYHQAKSARTY